MKCCDASIKHSALFYASQKELLSFLSRYFQSGLDNNELCLWSVPPDADINQMKDVLGETIIGLDSYIAKGQFIIGDHKNFYFKDNIFTAFDVISAWGDKETDALKKGFNGICVSADVSWAVPNYWFNFILYEKEIELIIDSHKIRALCSYSLKKLDMDKIFDIASSHKSSIVNQMGQWSEFDPNSFKR